MRAFVPTFNAPSTERSWLVRRKSVVILLEAREPMLAVGEVKVGRERIWRALSVYAVTYKY